MSSPGQGVYQQEPIQVLTLWGRLTSSNVQKVLWLCAESGIGIKRIDAGGAFGQTDSPAYRAKNPNGLVPMLEDGELVLWESNSILRYLSGQYGRDRFYPQVAANQALMGQWMDWQLSSLWPNMRPFFISLARTAEAERDLAATEAARQRSFVLWSMLDNALDSRQWIVGSAPSLAEIALGPFLHRWFVLYPEAASGQPALHRLYQRLAARPAYREQVMAQPFF